MLNPRIYRAGLVPALLALVVAAFSLQEPPRGVTTTLPPDAFNGARAFKVLNGLAIAHPERRPGSLGDTQLAGRIQQVFTRRSYRLGVRSFTGETVDGKRDLRTIIGRRVGLSTRQIVVLAHRDALTRPATAQLSGTAALLELARVFEGRRQRRTITLVSSSGGSGGSAGAMEFARATGGPIDAVIAVGDIAGIRERRPFVVPWSDGSGIAPLSLRRTVEAAVRLEAGRSPGDARGLSQLARLAFPATSGEQGVLLAQDVPAVLLQVSGERGPGSERAVSEERLTAFGRAVLRSITALDAAPAAVAPPEAAVLVRGTILPLWAVRLLVAGLLLPALLAIIDGVARAARRHLGLGMWLAWTLATAVPFALAVVFTWTLELTGLLPAVPPAPWPAGAIPLDTAAGAAIASVALVALAAWLGVRPLVVRLGGVRGAPSSGGAAAAVMLVLGAVAVAAWIVNPFAAAVLLLPVHLWLVVAAPEIRVRPVVAYLLVGLSLLPALLVGFVVAGALGAAGLEVPWTALLLVAGGHIGPLAALSWSLVLGCLICVLAIARAQHRQLADLPSPRTRGPASYAGPGSLGGTDSGFRR